MKAIMSYDGRDQEFEGEEVPVRIGCIVEALLSSGRTRISIRVPSKVDSGPAIDFAGHTLSGPDDECGQRWCPHCEANMTPVPLEVAEAECSPDLPEVSFDLPVEIVPREKFKATVTRPCAVCSSSVAWGHEKVEFEIKGFKHVLCESCSEAIDQGER